MPRVLLGIPHGGMVPGRMLSAVVGLVAHAPCPVTLIEREGCLGPDNRGVLAALAVEHDFTHLWLVDGDTAPEPDALTKLLAHQKDIVGASYHYRRDPPQSVVKIMTPEGEIRTPDPFPTTLFRAHAIGSGCQLITVDALRKIPRPWFALKWGAHGQLEEADDLWFCNQARSVGIETWCDPTIEAKHLGFKAY